jgi:hypothetical protein
VAQEGVTEALDMLPITAFTLSAFVLSTATAPPGEVNTGDSLPYSSKKVTPIWYVLSDLTDSLPSPIEE